MVLGCCAASEMGRSWQQGFVRDRAFNDAPFERLAGNAGLPPRRSHRDRDHPIYRKYYGGHFTVRITGLMCVTMVIAALVVDGMFSVLGLVPTGSHPTRGDIFTSIQVNYKLALNVLGLVMFAALFWLTARRGATDPVCGMKVDRAKAMTRERAGQTYYVCSEHCLHPLKRRGAGARQLTS